MQSLSARLDTLSICPLRLLRSKAKNLGSGYQDRQLDPFPTPTGRIVRCPKPSAIVAPYMAEDHNGQKQFTDECLFRYNKERLPIC